MRWKLLEDEPAPTLVAVLDPGDEAIGELSALVRERGVTAASLTAVGAFAKATVGWFDRAAQEYRRIPVDEQCEVLSLLGDVAVGEKGPQLHVHAVVGLSDGSTRGGHLLAGEVWPTLEVIIRETPAALHKRSRPDLGIAVIDLDR